jgi:hypothetical protein
MKSTYLIAAVFISCISAMNMRGMWYREGQGLDEMRCGRGCPVWKPIPPVTPSNGQLWYQQQRMRTMAPKKTTQQTR